MGEWIGDKHLVSSAKRKRWEKLIVRVRSLMKMMNRSGPRDTPLWNTRGNREEV